MDVYQVRHLNGLMRTHKACTLKNKCVMYITPHPPPPVSRPGRWIIYIIFVTHTLPDFDATMATADKMKKNSPNEWSFAAEYIQGEDEESSGNFAKDTMLCFSKHGTLALTFHASFNSRIVCSKCLRWYIVFIFLNVVCKIYNDHTCVFYPSSSNI